MTVTTLPRTTEPTPESQRLDLLLERLNDPNLAGFRDEIQQSIDELRAKTVLGA